uniref:Zinc finger AN1 and C2H2 domain-containing stress-associated protein 16 n=1 Tax=Kalanchoe fedtschenkoi TaxID=63787 RepID=A0A7N0VDF8_KALFE
MGTPQFPDLGKHCSLLDCKQIDFLPFTCDRCHEVFCLQHRSYNLHKCPNAGKNDVNVVICPLCAKGVRLSPDEDPNITWESHVNSNCDPSNYEKVAKKKKCPVPGCREFLTFSNTIKCRDCTIDHCLKHRFGPDHKCPGPPKKLDSGFPFLGLLNQSRKVESKTSLTPVPAASSNRWTTSFLNVASSLKASAEAGISKFSSEFNQAVQVQSNSSSSSRSGSGPPEVCPQCRAKFSSVTALVEHFQKVHETNDGRAGVKKVTIDACPKCSKGFLDPVSLVEHLERDHGGTSKA